MSAHQEIRTDSLRSRRGTLSSEQIQFANERPGFWATLGYPLLYLFAFGIGGFTPIVIALLGLYKNGRSYPARYGVYYPGYFWVSAIFAVLPVIAALIFGPM